MSTEGLMRLLPGASKAERAVVEQRLVRREIAANEVVFDAQTVTSMLCFVESGRLTVEMEKDGVTISLPDVCAGDWTGDANLLSPGPSAVTVTAVEPTVLRTLDAAQLDTLLDDNPVAGSALLGGLSVRLASRLRTASVPELTEDERGGLRADERLKHDVASGWVAKLMGRLLGGTEG